MAKFEEKTEKFEKRENEENRGLAMPMFWNLEHS
jgi:hypothetical protein